MECAVIETEKLKFLEMLVTFKLLTSVSRAGGGSSLSRCCVLLYFLSDKESFQIQRKTGKLVLYVSEKNIVNIIGLWWG